MHSRQKQRVSSESLKGSLVSRAFSMLLAFSVLAVQILLPLAPAFANEEPASSTVASNVSDSDSSSETTADASTGDSSANEADKEPEVIPDPPPQEAPPITESSLDVQTDDEEANPLSSDITFDPTGTPLLSEETPAPEATANGDTASDDGTVLNDDLRATSTPEEENADLVEDEDSTSPTNETDQSATTTPGELDDAIPEILDEPETIEEETESVPEEGGEEDGEQTQEETDTGTTTETTVVMPELHTVLADESQYTFSIDDCARVADGSFYCTEKTEEAPTYEDRVFAAPDADGDSEIFIEKKGELRQLTHNTDDDAAPFYDDRSKTIVFHRLVNARYQIISLDIDTGEEEQLTFDSYNNMQPSRYGDLIVWQGWVGNDWEVLMSEDGEIRMLTDNATHDIGPRINGEYIIWQAEKEDGWEVRVYNTLTGMTETIDDTNGASIENPRLVLVYDAKHENGDIETRGYDLVTGKNIALHSEAPDLPDQLPDPDQTGEERALINASQLKIKSEDEEGESGLPPPEPEPVTPEQTNSETDVLVIPPFDTGTSTIGTDNYSTTSEPLPTLPSIEDLVIPVLEESPPIPPIPDLEIPTFDESTTTEIDSQVSVAE